ncbi:hypothetical protein OsJ_17607 [Oryza sativa Japonica Group]|uniref:Uncharacterized protein n=1 Tax=Oryza sativa subsp. japonica TaxID=39947 RepID=B9FJ46_ORYSJ|nr:hypothetical protein OsJ_17607 [Oryza sativa Japonica Group]
MSNGGGGNPLGAGDENPRGRGGGNTMGAGDGNPRGYGREGPRGCRGESPRGYSNSKPTGVVKSWVAAAVMTATEGWVVAAAMMTMATEGWVLMCLPDAVSNTVEECGTREDTTTYLKKANILFWIHKMGTTTTSSPQTRSLCPRLSSRIVGKWRRRVVGFKTMAKWRRRVGFQDCRETEENVGGIQDCREVEKGGVISGSSSMVHSHHGGIWPTARRCGQQLRDK